MGGVPKLLLVAALGWGILGWGIAGQLQADDRFPSDSQVQSVEKVVDRPRSVNQHVAMKPDPQGGAQQGGAQQGGAQGGGGFNFPDAMPSSLMDEAAKIRDKIDKAGRTIEDRYNQTMGNQASGTSANAGAGGARSGLVPPPSTRASGSLGNNFAPPPFTGPTTDPGQRDNTWSAEAAARASAQGNFQGNAQGSALGFGQGPSTNTGAAGTVGFGDASRLASPTSNTANQSSNFQNSNGLRSTDMFGRMPSSLAGSNSFAGNTSAGQAYATQQDQVLADQRAAQQQQAQFGQTQPRQTQPLQSSFGQAQAGQASSSQTRTNAGNPTFDNRQYGNNGSFANSTQTPPSLNDPSVYGRSSVPEPVPYREATRTNPDSRLTDAQLRNNAWSVDKNGQIFDRFGKPMPNERLVDVASIPNDIATGHYGQYPARQQYPAGNPPSAAATAFGNQGNFANANGIDDRFAQLQASTAGSPTSPRTPYPTPATTGYSNAAFPSTGYQAAGYQGNAYSSPATTGNTSLAMSSVDYDRLARLERETELAEARRRLQQEESKTRPADPQISTAGVGALGGDRPPQVATDSLFKLLLMISIFGNVYLAFWLKNMRIRFRDMVTTKRLSNSSPSAT